MGGKRGLFLVFFLFYVLTVCSIYSSSVSGQCPNELYRSKYDSVDCYFGPLNERTLAPASCCWGAEGYALLGPGGDSDELKDVMMEEANTAMHEANAKAFDSSEAGSGTGNLGPNAGNNPMGAEVGEEIEGLQPSTDQDVGSAVKNGGSKGGSNRIDVEQITSTTQCYLEYKRPGGRNSYSCEKKEPRNGCIWESVDLKECFDNNIDGDFNCLKDDIYKAYSGVCTTCSEKSEMIDGVCYVTSPTSTNCVERPASDCDCYNFKNLDCDNLLTKKCNNGCKNNDACLDGFHRKPYNSRTCGTYINAGGACEFTPTSDLSLCLGIEGTDSCYDDPIKQELGGCKKCSETYKRSSINSDICQIRNEENGCEWTDEPDISKCIGIMGTSDCNDKIYVKLSQTNCMAVEGDDDDDDGVSNLNDKCRGTPSSEKADSSGCSCSQKSCNDNNPCTTDSCSSGRCSYLNNNLKCGQKRTCDSDRCDMNYPYKWLDFPNSGDDYCYNGYCTEYSCNLLSSYYAPVCSQNSQIETPPIPETCDGLDNDRNGKADDGLKPEYCQKQAGVCAGSRASCQGTRGWTECSATEFGTSYVEFEGANNCDGLDNDCDGAIDEGCICIQGETRKCGIDIGLCKPGQQTCVGSKWNSCIGGNNPENETCDGLDNDCDGMADEDNSNSASFTLSSSCNINACDGVKSCTKEGWTGCSLWRDNDEDDVCLPLDNCPNLPNSKQDDSDKDGIGDACDSCENDASNDKDMDKVCMEKDNCPDKPNPDQRDDDLDGIGDACDYCPEDRENDKDGDNLCIGKDNCPEKNNPGQEDCDKDGIGDGCDTNSICSVDSDADGLKDYSDNCPLISNPKQEDKDSDRIGDSCDQCMFDGLNDADKDSKCSNNDNCPETWNPEQLDSDSDGIGDICDSCKYDYFNDIDADKACGNIDNCNNEFNPSQSDCDNDNIGNACDMNSECSSDTDRDLVLDISDNCPEISNPDQIDSDNDGAGNSCDYCAFDPFNDADKDGICSETDNCPARSNFNQIDLDIDGIGDSCDICPQDKYNDIDKDGLCADLDNCVFKQNAMQKDCDNDGIGDGCDEKSQCTSDSDKDKIKDSIDNCPEVSNLAQGDKDGDGLGDICDPCMNDPLNDFDNDGICGNIDNCASLPNPNQGDSDNDDFGDECDRCRLDSENDFDKDRICGGYDNCRYRFNPMQEDCDRNGIGDACDKESACVRDDDGDLLLDFKDNCPNQNNPGQEDLDSDMIGDACDRCINDRHNDLDNDGYCSERDNCPLIFNPDQSNIDRDIFGDACDLCPKDNNNDIDEDGYCYDIDTCPETYNPGQEKDCIGLKVAKEVYDSEVTQSINKSDVEKIILESYGTIPNLSIEEIEKNIDDFRKHIRIERKEIEKDGKVFTKYKINIDSDKPLTDLAYYQKIPKCIAERTDNIYFNGKNYNIIEKDPIIAWHFAEVAKNVELTYEVEGSIPDSCLDELKGFAFSKKEAAVKGPISFILPLLIAIIIIILVAVFEKRENSEKLSEIVEAKAAEIRKKCAGMPDEEIIKLLEREGISKRYIKEIIKRL